MSSLLPLSRRPRLLSAAALAAAPPMVKLCALGLAVAAVGAAIQAGAWLLGLDFWILSKSASGLLIAVGLCLLLALVAIEGRPMADYGLIAESNWHRRAGRGLLLGLTVYGGYLGLAWMLGVVHFTTDAVSGSRIAKAFLAALTAGPIAVTQQIIFAGYLVSVLRDRHSRFTSVVVPAALFALAAAAGKGWSEPGWLLLGGLFLSASLLNLWRLQTGTIALSCGVLAGCIVVRKVVSKLRVVVYDADAPLADWLMPYGDPRMAPAMAVLIAAGIVAVSWQLWRHGERKPEASEDANRTFMRVLPLSNLMALAPIDRWAVLLWQSRFRVGAAYIPRLIVTLVASAANTVLSLPERLLCPLLLRRDPPDPVFIVGMPRSGTTHLHNLLSLDPRFRSPRNFEVFNPHGFLTGWLTTAVLTPVLSWRRPMDSMQMSVLSSQEEEFALTALGCESPYWSFCLPREIRRHDAYWRPEGFSPAQENRWARRYKLFLRKLTCIHHRVPLLKNPANTGRVKMLRKHFPRGKFIHIVRHPHDVYRSNQRLASHGLVVFQLQDPHHADNYATRCLENYRSLMDAYYADTVDLPQGTVAEVRYEDLVADPPSAIRGLYDQLDLEITPEFERRLASYLQAVSNYRRNQFATLSPDEQAEVNGAMAPYLQQWGYSAPRRAAA